MADFFRPLLRSSRDFSQKNPDYQEDDFRRELENYLITVIASLNSAVHTNSGAASLAAKRDMAIGTRAPGRSANA
tara:strand:- start:2909 stop:3133 length:225 start_codon:yes stop_codon:yes gene_type:complete